LLENTKDEGTVVRWSTAFSLGEMMKYNVKIKSKLKGKIEKLADKEKLTVVLTMSILKL